MWSKFPGCDCLRHILCECGFDNALSLKLITEQHLSEMENYVNSCRESILNSLTCNHANIYRSRTIFKFLPGHRPIILSWPAQILAQISSAEELNKMQQTFTVNHPAFSPILREIICSALTNHDRDPKGRTFSDLLMKFSMYIYILAGKASYEIICSNLPLPQAGTICMCSMSYFKLVAHSMCAAYFKISCFF